LTTLYNASHSASMNFVRPLTLAHATQLLAEKPHRILAGGTDIFPSLQGQPLTGPVLDVSAIKDLRYVREEKHAWHIGALTTWSAIMSAHLPASFNALKQAAREVGSVQIQSRATIAGNICNASPAADAMPPLLVLDATVVLQSERHIREIPLSDFVLGNRKQALEPGELLTEIRIPKSSAGGISNFTKLGARRYLVISIAMLAVRLVARHNIISDCAIAVGACSAVAQRLHRLEASLVGRRLNEFSAFAIDPIFLDGLSPITDVRSPGSYRLEAVTELLVRLIQKTASGLAS
jgi:CO/xanthine dehydrogenase FAD-binding subunit